MSGRIVKRSKFYPIKQYGRTALWHYTVAQRNHVRNAIRGYLRRTRGRAISKYARDVLSKRIDRQARERARSAMRNSRRHGYTRITGNASGTTHTTTRMIVRRTPANQRFIRKIFKNTPQKNKFVQRFGFSWMGASEASRTIWYSCCHLKFNNVYSYLLNRIISYSQTPGTSSTAASVTATGNQANQANNFVYLGKCTFSYELYNPTNYNMTVYIYDLICKRDTANQIIYSDAEQLHGGAPEQNMYQGEHSYLNNNGNQATWAVSDSVSVDANSHYNTVGMKPTDYHIFNTFWKVKGVKKIILPPTTGHHHTVVFNPKKKITVGGLLFPHQSWKATDKYGLGGLTQATLFGFNGQIATENDQTNDAHAVGNLPGKLLISCVRKINVYNVPFVSENIVAENALKTSFTDPKIFTDLTEQVPMAT